MVNNLLASESMKKNINSLILILLMTGTQVLGQSFSFKVKYGVIHAGAAKLIHTVENGILNSSLHIESSPWLSNLWSLSDSIRSTYDIETGRLLNHTKAVHEGSYHRNYEVVFSDSNKVAVNGIGRVLETSEVKDLPSLLFDLSTTRFKHGDTLRYHLWDGKGLGVLNLLVEKSPGAKLFKPFAEKGWRLTPLNSTKKSRENQIKLAMQMSDSFPHKPLRIEIDTKYGNIIMRLESP